MADEEHIRADRWESYSTMVLMLLIPLSNASSSQLRRILEWVGRRYWLYLDVWISPLSFIKMSMLTPRSSVDFLRANLG